MPGAFFAFTAALFAAACKLLAIGNFSIHLFAYLPFETNWVREKIKNT
jgi:hypothetical protein